MADLTLLFASYRQQLNSQEASITSLSAPSARVKAENEVLKVAVAEFGAQFDVFRKRCNALTAGLDPEVRSAYRHYTEAVMHPYVLSAPLPRQCYEKPLGYPGDFILMSYLYDPRPYGSTLYDKVVHQVVVRDEPMSIGVQKRKDFLLQQIVQGVQQVKPSSLPFRVLSLACGPAQEILEFAAERHASCAPTVFTMIDQDQRTLAHVNSCLARLLIPRATNIKAKYLYLGFKHMIGRHEAFDCLPEQDLIYAAGLFDYIKTPTAQRLVRRLFHKLKPGGRLVIGNFKSPNDATWALEFWMDWHLIYRSEDDMFALAQQIESPHDVEVTTDESGYTRMLLVTKH